MIYTSERRETEPVAAEDMPVMQSANALLYEMAAGTPLNEIPLIMGLIDIQWLNPTGSPMVAAEGLVTDRRFIVRWQRPGASQRGLLVFHHHDMIPRPEIRASLPFLWQGVIETDYPIRLPTNGRMYQNAALVINVHFSKDAHANRRSLSVQATLHEIERRSEFGQVI